MAAASPGLMNVLLIILDTVRAEDLSLYGYAVETTPALERFAQRGVVFENAFASAPWTLPSHAGMFTGYPAHQLSADYEAPLDDTRRTLAEALRDRGYATAGFAANLAYCAEWTGLNRGFVHYESHKPSFGYLVASSQFASRLVLSLRRRLGSRDAGFVQVTAPEINDAFLTWLDDRGDRPFFVFLNYLDAHDPYHASEPFLRRFAPGALPSEELKWGRSNYSKAAIRSFRASYNASIAYLDHHLEALFDDLARRNLLDNTLVIVTSDHGEHFGEHGLLQHANSLYLPLLRVPFLMFGPKGVERGLRVEEPVSLLDLPATIARITGTPDKFPGSPLDRFWTDAEDARSPILAELRPNRFSRPRDPIQRGPMKSFIAGRFHYIRNGDGAEEVYDWRADPGELNNVIAEMPQDSLRLLRETMQEVIARDRRSANKGGTRPGA
jgi:arylsulfatase A-like enzyme